jgi:hypothetical protein
MSEYKQSMKLGKPRRPRKKRKAAVVGTGEPVQKKAKARNGYIQFTQDMRPQIVAENPNVQSKDIFRHIGEAWGRCTVAEKETWRQKAKDYDAMLRDLTEAGGSGSGPMRPLDESVLDEPDMESSIDELDMSSEEMLLSEGDELVKIQCPFCPKRYTTNDNMEKHLQDRHPPRKAKEVPKKATVTRAKECNVCGARMTSKKALTKHMDDEHPGVKAANQCNVCGTVLENKKDLKTHIAKVHPDQVFFIIIVI